MGKPGGVLEGDLVGVEDLDAEDGVLVAEGVEGVGREPGDDLDGV